jgi:hypothetical protein
MTPRTADRTTLDHPDHTVDQGRQKTPSPLRGGFWTGPRTGPKPRTIGADR